jgi:hypothetical protein
MGEVAFDPFLSGRDNLRAAARRCGIGNKTVDGVLLRVGLAERAGDKMAGYSLRMRQRPGDPDHPGDLGRRLFAGTSTTERSDVAARGPLTSVSLVCLVASEPVACRSGS